MVTYRYATLEDVSSLCAFTDYWLAGRGKGKHVPGATNDYFVSRGQHTSYVKRGSVLLAYDDDLLVAWAVKHCNDSLIHLLVAQAYRKQGIGSAMLKILNPLTVRSKSDQETW